MIFSLKSLTFFFLLKYTQSYAAEIGTTVKELKLDDFRQRLENEKLLKVAADWADLQNKAMCTCTDDTECVPTDPDLVKQFNSCKETDDYTRARAQSGVCITSDYKSFSEPSTNYKCKFFCNDCKQLDYFETFNVTSKSLGKSWYHKGSEEMLNVSKLERFTKMIWPNEITDEYEKKYEPKGITLNVSYYFFCPFFFSSFLFFFFFLSFSFCLFLS